MVRLGSARVISSCANKQRGIAMFDIDETIDAFRRGALNLDCKRMLLAQHKEGGEHFEGQGYIRQSDDGTLTFKIYVVQHNAKRFGHLDAMFGGGAGKLHTDEMFYDLDATAHDGTRWTAARILLVTHWNIADLTVLAQGDMQSMTAHLDLPQKQHYLRLHFFEEYNVPLDRMSETEEHGGRYFTRNRAEFESCGWKFEVRKRDGSGDTVVEVISDIAFPGAAFHLRIQEALQYITGKTAIWRARIESEGSKLHLELASPLRKSARTQFSPPISPVSINFCEHGWALFGRYLSYVVQETKGTHWNPVAYHLYNACEATASSIDAWAVGVSVAVEAVASLINAEDGGQTDDLLALYQERARKWLDEQSDLVAISDRVKGQIDSISKKRPDDTLYVLAKNGHVEQAYVRSWRYLRNRHVHPTLKDLRKPDSVDNQKLLDNIHRVETLLRQLTFYLIRYEGPFTDYGVHGMHDFPSKQYPLSKT
jgi:hypothetical protein